MPLLYRLTKIYSLKPKPVSFTIIYSVLWYPCRFRHYFYGLCVTKRYPLSFLNYTELAMNSLYLKILLVRLFKNSVLIRINMQPYLQKSWFIVLTNIYLRMVYEIGHTFFSAKVVNLIFISNNKVRISRFENIMIMERHWAKKVCDSKISI